MIKDTGGTFSEKNSEHYRKINQYIEWIERLKELKKEEEDRLTD
jgi:hypothetical protein